MKWNRESVASAVEKDLRKPQLLLPFPEEKTIDVARACSILHVSEQVVHRLRVTPLVRGGDEMCLASYRTKSLGHLRIDYDSLVRFLDHVRTSHAIPDRRPAAIWGRHRDEDLLPFPWADTMKIEEAAEILSIHISKVLLRIEAGQFEAYHFFYKSPWRISRASLARVVASFNSAPTGARPYVSMERSQIR